MSSNRRIGQFREDCEAEICLSQATKIYGAQDDRTTSLQNGMRTSTVVAYFASAD